MSRQTPRRAFATIRVISGGSLLPSCSARPIQPALDTCSSCTALWVPAYVRSVMCWKLGCPHVASQPTARVSSLSAAGGGAWRLQGFDPPCSPVASDHGLGTVAVRAVWVLESRTQSDTDPRAPWGRAEAWAVLTRPLQGQAGTYLRAGAEGWRDQNGARQV